jgi:transposase
MLYLGIDLHSKQLTVNLRGEDGEVIMRRQVSTRGQEPRQFLEEVARRSGEGGYVAILEVCGFHDWLTELLPQCGCRETILIQPKEHARRKTDRRDASHLSEILWLNRERLLAGQKVQGVRRVVPPSPQERHDRRLTQLRRNAGAELTRTINGVQHILRRLNLGQHCPTKGFQTKAARQWLQTVKLPELDRFEMDQLLARWRTLEEQLAALEAKIAERAIPHPQAKLLRTAPGVGLFMSLAFAARIGNIERFATPRSLPNYFGLTPSCRNSGETGQRLGSITKEGSVLVRFLLGQLVLHVLRKDATLREWYRRIKKRRGAKIARVAVMRRLTVIFWHMLKHEEPYDLAASAKPKPTPRCKAKPAGTTQAGAAASGPSLGALPPNPRDLAPRAPFEGEQAQPRARGKKTSERPKPPALRTEPGSGARVASRQRPILPPG